VPDVPAARELSRKDGVVESLTKRRLGGTEIDSMTRRMFGPDVVVSEITELTDGMFNAVYQMNIAPYIGDVVLKSSPPPDVALLTYERDIMRTEAAFYRLAAQAPAVPVPRVLATDFTRSHLDGDLLVMSRVNGRGWSHLLHAINDSDDARLRRDLGTIVGHLHDVTGSRFGYFQPATAQGATWREAFTRMVDDVLADARRFGVRLPIAPPVVREVVDRHAPLLDAVTTPALVHFDLWQGNILLDDTSGRWEIAGLIDGERAMWADPAAEFVALSLLGDIAGDAEFLAGYRSVRRDFELTADVLTRVILYRTYLDLIMLVEATPRGYEAGDHAALLKRVAVEFRRCVRQLTDQEV
jgi:aminoglycoside phosphotransferase (APT) family kinase protein